MEKNYITRNTASGDRYSATEEKWEEYWKAWRDIDISKVMYFEEGVDEDFFYDPDK